MYIVIRRAWSRRRGHEVLPHRGARGGRGGCDVADPGRVRQSDWRLARLRSELRYCAGLAQSHLPPGKGQHEAGHDPPPCQPQQLCRKRDAAIVSLAHSLRLKIVAEAVETSERLKFLQSLGGDQYQGFHFSPLLPAPQFAPMLRDWQREEDVRSAAEATRTHSKLFGTR